MTHPDHQAYSDRQARKIYRHLLNADQAAFRATVKALTTKLETDDPEVVGFLAGVVGVILSHADRTFEVVELVSGAGPDDVEDYQQALDTIISVLRRKVNFA